mmetsp:Transcript_82752/g.161274  ORF Transcript_82752/g.161274 Transcript_82752/m.161274 type:complete len:129 (-) Transcript_82752:190-576(-)
MGLCLSLFFFSLLFLSVDLAPTEAQGYPQVRLETPRNIYVVTRTNIDHSSSNGEERRRIAQGWCRQGEQREACIFCLSLSLFLFFSLLASSSLCMYSGVVRKKVPMTVGQDIHHVFQPDRKVLARPGS